MSSWESIENPLGNSAWTFTLMFRFFSSANLANVWNVKAPFQLQKKGKKVEQVSLVILKGLGLFKGKSSFV